MSELNVAIIVPRRPDGGRRDQLWTFCREWYEALGWRIFEGAGPSGPFNRGAALNEAADRALDAGQSNRRPVDVLVVLDGDVLVPRPLLVEAVERANETGKLVTPYDRYAALNSEMTDRAMDEYRGDWSRGVELWMDNHVSSVLAVPVSLWRDVHGFDERIQGWGWDDLAFWSACSGMGGTPERLHGIVWHLWHPKVGENTQGSGVYRSTPDYLAGQALCARYESAADHPVKMGKIMAERNGATANDAVVTVLTTGTRGYLADTVASIDEMVSGPIARKLLIVDGAVHPEFEGWDVVNISAGGYRQAMAGVYHHAMGSGQPWVFHSEDDFTFNRPVDLRAMQVEMDAFPDLAQLSLLRQSWFEPEIEAGGILEMHGREQFEPRGLHLRHAAYWTTNPHLIRRSLMARYPWPQKRWSESAYGQAVFSSEPTLTKSMKR